MTSFFSELDNLMPFSRKTTPAAAIHNFSRPSSNFTLNNATYSLSGLLSTLIYASAAIFRLSIPLSMSLAISFLKVSLSFSHFFIKLSAFPICSFIEYAAKNSFSLSFSVSFKPRLSYTSFRDLITSKTKSLLICLVLLSTYAKYPPRPMAISETTVSNKILCFFGENLFINQRPASISHLSILLPKFLDFSVPLVGIEPTSSG